MATHSSSNGHPAESGTYTHLNIVGASGDIVFKIRKFEHHLNQSEASIAILKDGRQPVLIAADVLRLISPPSFFNLPDVIDNRLSQLRREGNTTMLIQVARRALSLTNDVLVDREKEAEATAEREELAILLWREGATGNWKWESLAPSERERWRKRADAAKAYFLAEGKTDD